MIAPTPQKLLTYPNQVPLVYANSSLMSPDRRALYLGHPKSGTRKVHPIKTDQIASLTTDPRMPIDLCCVHESDHLEHTYVFFSSKMVNVAKIKEERDDLGRLGAVAAKAIADKPSKIENDELKNLPRKKATRQQLGYDRIPISREGKLLLTSQHYPKLPESEKTIYSLDTAMWYVWFAILSEYGDNFSSVVEWDQEPYFVVQNPYHIIAQAL